MLNQPRHQSVALLLLTTGLVLVLLTVVTFEWSYSYCLDPQDGPALPMYGLPLPYYAPSAASSLHWDFMPHILVLNVLILALPLYGCIRWLLPPGGLPRWGLWLTALSGGVVTGLYLLGLMYLCVSGTWSVTPDASAGGGSIDQATSGYLTARPVRLVLVWETEPAADCPRSDFWFGD